MQNHLLAIGIMTGNSLDGADLVLSSFGLDGAIKDVDSLSIPFPEDLKGGLRAVREAIGRSGGRVEEAIGSLDLGIFDSVLGHYTNLLARAVADLRAKHGELEIDLIGLHGQTCGHCPPSIAGTGDLADVSTVQIGDGQALADLTGVSVVYDFRSDDLMAGGEGAPLAPVHHRHLAGFAEARGFFPIAFCNGGNTGNVSIISKSAEGEPVVIGWDTGPFNHFPDRLMQLQAGQACDFDAAVGRRGVIRPGLLALLFDTAVRTRSGENFLLQTPPKSSDPDWYRLIPELLGEAPVGGEVVPFEDRVRTATYFASYTMAHSLALISPTVKPPTHFAVCGGGWRNPLCLGDFRNLLSGNQAQAPTLPQHAATFTLLQARSVGAEVEPSSHYGFDGTAMEARIFADAAVSRIKGEPFTLPATTGVFQPTVCGIIRFPQGLRARATEPLRAWLDHFGAESATVDLPDRFDGRWSRASAGWSRRIS